MKSTPVRWISVSLLGFCGGVGACFMGLGQPSQAQVFRPDRPDFFEEGQQQFEEEIERLEQQQPDVPLLTVEGEATTWSPVLIREGGYGLWMPQGATAQSTQQVETSGGPVTFTILSTHSAIGQFVTAFSEPLRAALLDSPEAVLERVQNRISSEQTGFELVGDRLLEVDGAAAREFTLQNAQEVITFRVLLAGDRLYVLAVSQSPDRADPATVTAFFNSFQRI